MKKLHAFAALALTLTLLLASCGTPAADTAPAPSDSAALAETAGPTLGEKDPNVNYTLRVWCETADYWDLYYDLLEQVRDAFDREGIDITYPHLNVHLKKD